MYKISKEMWNNETFKRTFAKTKQIKKTLSTMSRKTCRSSRHTIDMSVCTYICKDTSVYLLSS